LAFEGEHQPEAFFEEVGAVQAGIGLGDPGELVVLAVGQVLGVLPQGVAGLFQGGGVTGVSDATSGRRGGRTAPAGVVPCVASHHVERVGRPFDDVERVSTADGVRAVGRHDPGDPVGPVG
jgi:hypothetical protein